MTPCEALFGRRLFVIKNNKYKKTLDSTIISLFNKDCFSKILEYFNNIEIILLILQAATEDSFNFLQLIKITGLMNTLNNNKQTSLIIALQKQMEYCAMNLINCGADYNYMYRYDDSYYNYSFGYASYFDMYSCINFYNYEEMTIWIHAVINNHINLVKLLINKGVDINQSDNFGNTALTVVCKNSGSKKIIKTLLKAQKIYDMNINTIYSIALINASSSNKITAAKLLLEAGANPNLIFQDSLIGINRQSTTALIKASENNNIKIMELLIKYKSDINKKNITDEQKDSTMIHVTNPILKATIEGNIEAVKCLLSHGALIDVTTKTGDTPLLLACYYGHTKIVKLLIENGANIKHISEDNKSVLVIACENDNHKIVQILLENGVDPNNDQSIEGLDHYYCKGFSIALNMYSLKIIKLLVYHGLKINPDDDYFKAQIHNIDIYRVSLIKYLVEKIGLHPDAVLNDKKYNKNTITNGGYNEYYSETPMLRALLINHREVAIYLLFAGADPHERVDGVNSLQLASLKYYDDYEDLVLYLLDKGLDPNECYNKDVRINYNSTPFLQICENGSKKVLKALVDAGADVNSTDYNGNSPLMISMQNNNVEGMDYFIEIGLDLNYRNSENDTPLTIAIKEKNKKCVNSLLKNGANPDLPDRYGYRPYIIAKAMQYNEILPLLVEAGAGDELNQQDIEIISKNINDKMNESDDSDGPSFGSYSEDSYDSEHSYDSEEEI